MTNLYNHRDRLKDALSLPTTSTGDHDQLDDCLEVASRLIDDWLGYHLYALTATKHLTARDSTRLVLREPLTGITALRTDPGGDGTYETTWSTASYYLAPYEATGGSPPRPYWEIEVRSNSTVVFPEEIERGVEILGTWGRYDQRVTSTAVLATGVNATATILDVTSATSLHPGQTIRLDDETLFIERVGQSGSATASGSILVQRAVNGSTAATHASGTAFQVHTYPLADRAALYQAQQDFKGGLTDGHGGGQPFGETSERRWGEGDLHPAVRRMLRGFRLPIVR